MGSRRGRARYSNSFTGSELRRWLGRERSIGEKTFIISALKPFQYSKFARGVAEPGMKREKRAGRAPF
jgi:hypothetical protein